MAETIWDNKNPVFNIIIVILTLNFSGFFLPNLLQQKGIPDYLWGGQKWKGEDCLQVVFRKTDGIFSTYYQGEADWS